MTSRLVRLALLAVGLAVTAGCASAAPRVRVEHLRPARFLLEPQRRVALVVEAEGGKPSASDVLDAAIGATQGRLLNRWVAVEALRSELEAQLRRAGFTLVAPEAADVVVHVVPTGWAYQPAQGQDLRTGGGRLDARVEVRDARAPDAPPLFQDAYWAKATVENVGEPEALVRAAQRLSQRFLMDLQPTRVAEEVELDASDPRVRPGVQLAREGKLDAARAAFQDAVDAAPDSGPALYDLAVLLEAEGRHEEAEALLARAARASPKPLYYEALARVRRERAQAPPPAPGP